MKKLFLILVFALASFAGANAQDWSLSIGAGDGLPGESVQKGTTTVQVYKSDVIKPTEALTTLRFTVAQNYNGERPNGGNFVTALSELVIYAADGETKIPYTATSNADHNSVGSDGQGLAALNDGNWTNYWHSSWSSNLIVTDYHHIELTFAEPISEFVLEWGARPGNPKNAPMLVGLTKGGVDYVPYSDWAFTVGEQITTMDQLEGAQYFVMKSNVPVEYHTYVNNHNSTEGAFGTQITKEPNVGPGPQYVNAGSVAEEAAPEYAIQLIPADGGYYLYYVTEGKFLSKNPTDNAYNGANGTQGKTAKMSDAAIVTITEVGNGRFEMSYMMEYEGEEIEIHVGATPSTGGFKNVDKERYDFYMEGHPYTFNYAYIITFDWTLEEVSMNYPAKYTSIPVRNAIKEAKSIYTFMDSVAVEGYEYVYDEFMAVLQDCENTLAAGYYTEVEKVFDNVETLNAAMGAYVYSKIEWICDVYIWELEAEYIDLLTPSTNPQDGFYLQEAYDTYIAENLMSKGFELYELAYDDPYSYLTQMKTFINGVQGNIDAFLASKIEYVTLPKVYTTENPHQTPLGTLVNNNRYDWEQLVVLNEPVNGIRLTFLETNVGTAASDGKYKGYPMVAISGLEVLDADGNPLALSSSLVSTNSLETSEGSLENLFDDETSTFYHSIWGNGTFSPETYVYLDVKFPEGVELSTFTIKTIGHRTASLAPGTVCITKYGEESDLAIFRENPYNVAGGTQITDASQLKDGGLYIISGNLRVKTQEAAPRFYAGTAPYHSNIKAALNDPCVYMFKKTANGWNIISLANAQYWALNKTVNEETGETTVSTSLTVYPSNAAEVKFAKSGNLENTFVIYSDIEDNNIAASFSWTNPNDETDVVTVEEDTVNANKFVFMDWDSSLSGRPCASVLPGDVTYGKEALSAHAKYEDFKNGDGYSAGDNLHFNKANGEGEWNIYEVTMDDPYFLWATGIVASLDDLGIILGKDPGCIQGDIPVLDAAIESFKSIVANEDKARAQAAVEAFVENIDLLQSVERVKVQDGCYYAIESAYPQFNAQQGKVKAIYATENGLAWMDAPASYKENPQFVFQFQQYDGENDPDCLGVPEGEENNVFKIYSDAVGMYAGTGGGTTQVPMTDDFGAALYVVKPIESNIYTIYAVGSDPFHTAGHGSGAGANGTVVNWTGGVGTASSWYLKLVEDFDINDVPPVEKPLEIVAITPSAPVDKLSTVTITFSDEIEGTFDMMAMSHIYLGSRSNVCSYVVKGNVLTITPFNAITTSGEYGLVIPEGLITRKSNGEKISLNKEIVFTVKAPLAALEITGYTPTEVVEALSSITIEFNKAIEFIQIAGGTGTGTSGLTQYIRLKDANGGVVANAWVSAATIDGNKVTFVFEMNAAITKTGTYSFEIPAGLIKATDGEVFAGQTFTFQVEAPESVEIQDGCYYAIESAYPGFYNKQGKVKAIHATENGLAWMDAPEAYNGENAQFVFQFQKYDGENDPEGHGVPKEDADNVYRIYSDVVEMWVGTGGDSTQVYMTDDFGAGVYVIKPLEANVYTIYAIGSDPLHAEGYDGGDGESGRIINRSGGVGTPSTWYIRPVEDFDVNDIPPVEEPLEVVSVTPTEPVESLSRITIRFNDEIMGTYDSSSLKKIYLGSSDNVASFRVIGNVLTISLLNAITESGEYGLVIPAGLITRRSNGESVTMNKEIVFTVEAPVVYENTMEIDDVTVNAGEQVTLSFNMKNDSEISCYQCDLYLPDGMSVATDNYGNKLINVSYERTTPSRHRCSFSELPDGGIRILSYSTNNYTFIGNEGEVLTVTVNVDSDVDNGDYTVMLRNIEMTQPDETYYITELTTATVSVYTEIPGDINGDRYHTIADVQAIVNLILTGVKAVDYPKADVNGDNRISITDLQAIVNLVLYQKSYAATHGMAKRAKRNYESENSLYIEPFSISAGEEKQVLIKLDNPSDAFSALQFDLYLPEGIDVATDNSSLALGSRTDDFNHNHPMSAYQEDGALRVICYSNSSSEFSNTSGDVITITLTAAPDLVDGSYDIEIRNVELARRDATADRPADTTTRVSVDSWTGISDMTDDGAEVEVYDVYGRKVTKAEKRGIYIVNGKKVFNK